MIRQHAQELGVQLAAKLDEILREALERVSPGRVEASLCKSEVDECGRTHYYYGDQRIATVHRAELVHNFGTNFLRINQNYQILV